MTLSQIKDWLTYWNNARMVALDEIRAFDQVHQARKFCACMRQGIFHDVTDLQIWNALKALRSSPERGEG
jgi:hypothetical protein